MKKLLEKKWFFDLVLVISVVALSTILMIPVLDGFGSWLNAMTDIVIGCVEALIVTSFIGVLLGEKRFRTWQYAIPFTFSLLAVLMLFMASRADSAWYGMIFILITALSVVLYAITKRLFYIPSTWTIEERQQHVWEKIRLKARKMSRPDFLALEMEFRCYPTIDGKIDSDLDVSNPWATIYSDDLKMSVPLTYKGAVAHNMDSAAKKISDALIAELDASGIV